MDRQGAEEPQGLTLAPPPSASSQARSGHRQPALHWHQQGVTIGSPGGTVLLQGALGKRIYTGGSGGKKSISQLTAGRSPERAGITAAHLQGWQLPQSHQGECLFRAVVVKLLLPQACGACGACDPGVSEGKSHTE